MLIPNERQSGQSPETASVGERDSAPRPRLCGRDLETHPLLRRITLAKLARSPPTEPRSETAPASGGVGPDRSGRAALCHGVGFGQHFVDEHVNIDSAFDFYAGRKTIATGVIEATMRPVGFNSPVAALTSN